MIAFNIGDRVTAIKDYDGKCINGLSGRVVGSLNHIDEYPVEFDRFINGHTCGEKCPNGHGWWVHYSLLDSEIDELEPVSVRDFLSIL